MATKDRTTHVWTNQVSHNKTHFTKESLKNPPMNRKAKLWMSCGASICLLMLAVVKGQAEDTYETLVVGTNTLKNARVIQASPVDLLLGHDEGFRRIKLQELPDSLKAKYPYDAQKAAEYEKQKVEEKRLRQTQNAAAIRSTLLAKEEELRSRIKPLETELQRLNKEIGTQDKKKAGKGVRSKDRKLADELRARKMQVRDQIWRLRDELERTEAQRKKFE
jgi:hypothetical protein